MAPLVKVCGLKSVENALACAHAGADWIGLNFHPMSARQIHPEVAAQVVAALGGSSEAVGLFVNRPPDEIREFALRIGLNLIQLHGDEAVEDLVILKEFRVIRAFRIADLDSLARMRSYLKAASDLGVSPYAVLVDAFVPGREGGTGHRIPDGLLAELPRIERLILAGGLTPANVSAAVSLTSPWMVDVASGVESSPGVKDPKLVEDFVKKARTP